MNRAFAKRLLDRVEDHAGEGDPKCRLCHGSGSVRVSEVCAHARCVCRDKIEEAYEMVGDQRWQTTD